MDEVFAARCDVDRHNVARHLGREGDFTYAADRSIFRHEETAAAGNAFEHAHQAAAPAKLGVRGHLDGCAHPGKFTSFGYDGVIVIKQEFEDRHGGADDAALHVCFSRTTL